jgi:hydroxypyruvate isomerase
MRLTACLEMWFRGLPPGDRIGAVAECGCGGLSYSPLESSRESLIEVRLWFNA